MAKSTAHKALASINFKLAEALRVAADATTNFKRASGAYQNLKEEYIAAHRVIVRQREELREFRAGAVVTSSMFNDSVAELKRANEQVVNLQNRNAKLRNAMESQRSTAWVVGSISIAAAYLLGTAIQHFYPIAI